MKDKAMKIDAQIDIRASYDDAIQIEVRDKASNAIFLSMVLTREQFINAAMNKLGCTEVKETRVRYLERIGKEMKMDTLTFEIPDWGYQDNLPETIKLAYKNCPDGWIPDVSFSSQNSFYTGDDGKHYARTIIRKWE
jgi:hypothetical protein